MDMAHRCTAEVRRLHAFFVDWFADDREDPRVAFVGVEEAFHPAFSMVLPSGETIDRTVTLEQVRAAHGSASVGPGVAIEIVEHTTLVAAEDAALVSYQERQWSGRVLLSARTSTAYFVRAPHAPHGVQWFRLHETLADQG